MPKLITVDKDCNIAMEKNDIDSGEYENKMIAFADSTKGFIIARPGTGKRLEVPAGNILFQLKEKGDEDGTP